VRQACGRAGRALVRTGGGPDDGSATGHVRAPLYPRPAGRRRHRDPELTTSPSAPVAPLAVSLGEPAGVGPEIVAAAWAVLGAEAETPAFVVIGDAALLERAGAPVAVISDPSEAPALFRTRLPVIHRPVAAPVTPGQADPANAGAVTG